MVLEWDNQSDDLLVHLNRDASAIRTDTFLKVREDQFAVYEAGGKRIGMGSGTGNAFRDARSPAETAALLRAGYPAAGLTFVLGGRLFFMDAREHILPFEAEAAIAGERWKVTVRGSLTFRLAMERAAGLLDQALDWSGDESASSAIRTMTETAAREAVIRRLQAIPAYWRDDPSRDAVRVRNAVTAGLDEGTLADLADEVNQKISARGVTLTRAIHINAEQTLVEESVPGFWVDCPRCGKRFSVHKRTLPLACPQPDCGQVIQYCHYCKGFTTADRRHMICDRCDRRVAVDWPEALQ